MIKTNVEAVRKEIEKSSQKVNRDPKVILLLAASKGRSLEQIKEVYNNGVTVIGENKVQELKSKLLDLPKDLRVDFIGHLQTNKIRDVIASCFLIHSIDSFDLAKKIDDEAFKNKKKQAILLQINVAKEETKSGFEPDEIVEIFPKIKALKNVIVKGLMAIAPKSSSVEAARPVFSQLRELRNRLQDTYYYLLPELSMGMTDDYKIAIEEGATIIRLGRIIFE
jgi:hypothetical protein